MYTVEDVGKEEAALEGIMPVGGHIEARDAYLESHGLYQAWRDVYSKYVRLADAGDLEALKRAIFFAWFQISEPHWLSGIYELPDEQTKIVADTLEEYLLQGHKDQELEQMLPYYMVVSDYYLERFYPLPNIQKASLSVKDQDRPLLGNSKWEYRGQMGTYWRSIEGPEFSAKDV